MNVAICANRSVINLHLKDGIRPIADVDSIFYENLKTRKRANTTIVPISMRPNIPLTIGNDNALRSASFRSSSAAAKIASNIDSRSSQLEVCVPMKFSSRPNPPLETATIKRTQEPIPQIISNVSFFDIISGASYSILDRR